MEVFCLVLFLFLPSNLKIEAVVCRRGSECRVVCNPGEIVLGHCTLHQHFQDIPGYCCASGAAEDEGGYCIEEGEEYKCRADDGSWELNCCSGGECNDDGYCVYPSGIQIQNPLQAAEFEVILDNIIGFIFNVAVVLAPLMIVIAGFLFVTAAGNSDQINRARAIIVWTAIGFLIILLSRGIMGIIRKILGLS